jgi:hypothetical protein
VIEYIIHPTKYFVGDAYLYVIAGWDYVRGRALSPVTRCLVLAGLQEARLLTVANSKSNKSRGDRSYSSLETSSFPAFAFVICGYLLPTGALTQSCVKLSPLLLPVVEDKVMYTVICSDMHKLGVSPNLLKREASSRHLCLLRLDDK